MDARHAALAGGRSVRRICVVVRASTDSLTTPPDADTT
jgi:hypothetical protein